MYRRICNQCHPGVWPDAFFRFQGRCAFALIIAWAIVVIAPPTAKGDVIGVTETTLTDAGPPQEVNDYGSGLPYQVSVSVAPSEDTATTSANYSFTQQGDAVDFHLDSSFFIPPRSDNIAQVEVAFTLTSPEYFTLAGSYTATNSSELEGDIEAQLQHFEGSNGVSVFNDVGIGATGVPGSLPASATLSDSGTLLLAGVYEYVAQFQLSNANTLYPAPNNASGSGSIDFILTPEPEPGSLAIAATGFLLLRRRRR
jgi:hypothetical protein